MVELPSCNLAVGEIDMCKLILEAWLNGLNKVALNHELQKRANMSLSEAKQCVNDLLDGKEPVINLISREQAVELLKDIQALGVVGRIEC